MSHYRRAGVDLEAAARAVDMIRDLASGTARPETVDAVLRGDILVSSTAIRDAVAVGDLGRATGLLGRVHDMDGTVVPGDQRGRTLGFPTANLQTEAVLAPPDGVYAVRVRVLKPATTSNLDPSEGSTQAAPWLPGVANLGVRPTFGAGRTLEVHLLDTQQDLYGARLRVGFVERLRGEHRFEHVEALKAQIVRDVEAARRRLSEANPETLRWM
jgi:riboflavin kinase / FMN adenylyltransferase